MAEQKFVYVDVDYLKELEETAKKVDYYKGIIDGINMVADHKTEPSFKVDGIGDDDPTIHAIAHLQKVGWLQEHDRILTEPQICDTCRYYNDYIPCGSTPSACKEADKFAKEFAVALMKLKPQTERSE